MPSDERLLKQGRLAELENQAKVLSIKIHGLRNQIHKDTDQFKPIDQVEMSALRVAVDELCEADLKLIEIQKTIRDLREDLRLQGRA